MEVVILNDDFRPDLDVQPTFKVSVKIILLYRKQAKSRLENSRRLFDCSTIY